ncbi:MAG: phospho-N-acetylmuramoyl-pentapeptide-transferase [Gaiellaceae bacterium]|nr:phospho-N-acetylmuramoyl-pentapeptide-transferase [Gaiellaceae bacterium]
MTRALAAAVLAAVISVLAGPRFVQLLRRLRYGQNIREDGPEHHKTKQGTPTMGGLLIVASSAVAYLLFTSFSTKSLAVLAALLGCAVIGFADDWLKVIRKRSLGLKGRWKLLGQAAVAGVISLVAHHEKVSTEVFVPIIDFHVDLGPGWFALVFLMVLGATNAVNLTDGLDGLASGITALVMLVFTGMAVVGYQAGQRGVTACLTIDRKSVLPECRAVIQERLEFRDQSLDLAILAAALLGACIGFLWYNAFPADVFMGDTGSLALGGAVAAFAVFTKTELLLPLVGGVFVAEALSVIIQVISFKRTGKRVFLMAPIHHHFEMKAWSETKIMVRFWILAALCAGASFVLFYLRFDQYR